MSKEALEKAEVDTVFQQKSSASVPQHVRGQPAPDASGIGKLSKTASDPVGRPLSFALTEEGEPAARLGQFGDKLSQVVID